MGGGLAYQLIGLGDEKPPGYAAGRFLQRVDYVLAGFTAIEAVLPDDLKQEVQAALTLLQGVRAVALDRRAVPEALPIKIEQTADQLVDAAEGLGQVAAAADEQGLEDLQDLQ
jgi:hypothetical protein